MDVPPDVAVTPAPPAADDVDLLGRLLASTALAVAALCVLEMAGTISVGLAVDTERLNFLHRQGYAFLTLLEKSPVALGLILTAVLGAVALVRTETDTRSARLARLALWMAVGAAVVVGIGAVLAVLARFRVAELPNAEPINGITRRILFTFIVRNFGAAVLAMLVCFGALFRPPAKPVVVA